MVRTQARVTLAKPAKSVQPVPSSLELALAAAETAEDNRGRDLVILDMREISPMCDYFVIATGTSRRQLHAMSEAIDDRLGLEMGDERLGIEGYRESRWILLDYGNVMIHLFDAETRGYYALENLWGEAPQVSRPARPKLAKGSVEE